MNLEGPKAEAETAKQIIALSTGAVAFTVTFLEKFRSSGANQPVMLPRGLYVAWVLFGITIGVALWYLMALTGNISAVARKENGWHLTDAEKQSAEGDESNTRLPGILMVASFFFSVVSLIWLGFSLG
jgi:hypothetical protein